MKSLITIFVAGLLLFSSLPAATWSGRITLREGAPAPFATVFVPSLGVGTITDAQGRYLLEVVSDKNVMVEISYLGYTTHVARIDSLLTGDSLRTVSLVEQPIALHEVFVTPNGEDPATYIFRMVHEKAVANRKQLQYKASITSSFQTQDLDIIPMVLPKMVLWMVKGAMAMTEAGKMFGISIEHQKIQAKGSIQCLCQKGKCKYDDWKMLESTLADKDFEKTLREQTAVDPFLFVYEDYMKLKNLPQGFVLKGTVEENGRTIDVLYRANGFEKQDGKLIGDTTYLYIVEEDWGILRRVEQSASGLTRLECRRNGQGVWLPISYVDDPAVISVNDAMKEALEEYQEEEKMSRMERKMMTRIRDIANGNRQFTPCLTMCYYFQW